MPLSTVHAVHVPAAHGVGPSFVARMPLVNHGYAYVGQDAPPPAAKMSQTYRSKNG